MSRLAESSTKFCEIVYQIEALVETGFADQAWSGP
jgi:hypothetical protein